jgi:hypothetical protein
MYSFVKGTLDFMPLEVETGRYEFPSPPKDPDDRPPRPVFRYNFIHDLESLWRVALWVIFNNRDSRNEVVHPSVEDQTEHARYFFPGILSHRGRSDVLKHDGLLSEATETLPESFKVVVSRLEVMRQGLVKHYRQAEATAEIDSVAFQGIHTLFLDELKKAKDRSVEIKLCPLNDPPPPKRSRRNSTASDAGSDRVTSPTPKPKAKRAKVTGT